MIVRIEKKSMQRCDDDEPTKKQLAEIRQLYNDKNKQAMMQELFN
jgi:hypothetical protein